MPANPYTLPNTGIDTGIGWYDFDAPLRERMLGEAHPAKTVTAEWVAPDLTVTRYEFTRERKRLLGPDLLKISVTRRAGTADARTYTWHNVSRIRLEYTVHPRYGYELRFVGKDPAGAAEDARVYRQWRRMRPSHLAEDESVFHYPYHWQATDTCENWTWPRAVYETQRHVFEELGLTLHRTRDDAGKEVLEYRL